jgi:membrane protease YdiL (CAAX protease family)
MPGRRKGENIMNRLPFLPLAWTLAIFAAVVFTVDNLAGALLPNWWVMQRAWELLLPDFTFGTWGGFFIGLVESFAGGFLTAMLFVPIWNLFAAREETQGQMTPEMKPASQHRS